MEYPLEKYKRFIENVEKELLFDKHGFTRITCAHTHEKYSPNAVAKIIKTGKGFAIRYVYGGFNKIYEVKDVSSVKIRLSTGSGRTLSGVECVRNKSVPISVVYKLRRISSRNSLTHKILEEVIKCQRRYLETADPIDLVPFSQVQLPIDNSWTSRLVNRLSVITPSGEEKPLKWFFQTQKDINKRLIKQLLDKENKDIETGRLNKPLTDDQIRAKLESEYKIKLSRHSVGHCRKDMGIPPAKRRLSGYKYPPLSANFSVLYPLTVKSVQSNAPAASGIYEFRVNPVRNKIQTAPAISNGVKGIEIEYPNGNTQVIYIGRAKNLKKRLKEHLRVNNKNGRIRDFLSKFSCSFRYILFKRDWQEEERKLYKLFMDTYGLAPKCNRVKPGGKSK